MSSLKVTDLRDGTKYVLQDTSNRGINFNLKYIKHSNYSYCLDTDEAVDWNGHETHSVIVLSTPPLNSEYNTETSIDTAVYNPKHYSVIGDVEAIELIARSMTVEMFKGYCLGNLMKYRLRLGAKDAVEQDLKKAQNYVDIFEKQKVLCYDYVS